MGEEGDGVWGHITHGTCSGTESPRYPTTENYDLGLSLGKNRNKSYDVLV